jgi:hypothetical protein
MTKMEVIGGTVGVVVFGSASLLFLVTVVALFVSALRRRSRGDANGYQVFLVLAFCAYLALVLTLYGGMALGVWPGF